MPFILKEKLKFSLQRTHLNAGPLGQLNARTFSTLPSKASLSRHARPLISSATAATHTSFVSQLSVRVFHFKMEMPQKYMDPTCGLFHTSPFCKTQFPQTPSAHSPLTLENFIFLHRKLNLSLINHFEHHTCATCMVKFSTSTCLEGKIEVFIAEGLRIHHNARSPNQLNTSTFSALHHQVPYHQVTR